jgi:centromeric protein E
LKFAHRAKHIEIQAAQNKIIDEKSLIKKYQNEIRCLKEELEQLKKGIVTVPQLKNTSGDDLVVLKQKLEDGDYKLQSRLEQEEEAKAALMSRIQRLTKLILVSTKSTQSPRYPHRPGPRRRHSFGEEELAYLPFRRRDLILDDENIDLYVSLDSSTEIAADYTLKEDKKTKKHGLLNWLKPKKRDSVGASASEKSSGVKSVSSTPSTPRTESANYHVEPRHSHSLLSESTPSAELFSEARQELRDIPDDNFLREQTPLMSVKSIDQIDLMREQQKILSGEVALHQSALKRLSGEAARDPKKQHIHAEIKRMDEEIRGKNEQIDVLEKNIAGSFISSFDVTEGSRSAAELEADLNEKALELEVKTADNRIIREQLTQKICECEELEQAISSLRRQLSEAVELQNSNAEKQSNEPNKGLLLEAQASEIKQLKHKLDELTESNQELEHRNKKLAEESSYAKGLASAAAVELKALSEEVAKLMNHNAKLSAELAANKNPANQRNNSRPVTAARNGRREITTKNRHDPASIPPEVRRELALSREREQVYEAALAEKDQNEAELQRRVEESKQREAYLENELANMWVLVAKLKKSQGPEMDTE